MLFFGDIKLRLTLCPYENILRSKALAFYKLLGSGTLVIKKILHIINRVVCVCTFSKTS